MYLLIAHFFQVVTHSYSVHMTYDFKTYNTTSHLTTNTHRRQIHLVTKSRLLAKMAFHRVPLLTQFSLLICKKGIILIHSPKALTGHFESVVPFRLSDDVITTYLAFVCHDQVITRAAKEASYKPGQCIKAFFGWWDKNFGKNCQISWLARLDGCPAIPVYFDCWRETRHGWRAGSGPDGKDGAAESLKTHSDGFKDEKIC